MDCDHIYGYTSNGEVNRDNYNLHRNSSDLNKYTYCPYCRVQLHTIDGVPLRLPEDDDCIRGGCED